MSQSVSNTPRQIKPQWYAGIATFARPDGRRAVFQLLDSVVPYILLIALMILCAAREVSFFAILALSVVATPFFIRTFIIFHDCVHGSFLPSPRLNRVVGYVAGILTFTPFDDWRRTHAVHHMTAGDLDRRGTGDIWMLTLEEYRGMSPLKRLGYRLYRNPLVMFGIGPAWVFLLRNRLPFRGWKKRDLSSVLLTNMAILSIIAIASVTVGFTTYVTAQMPVLVIAATAGVWLFYVQHNFQGVYWARHADVDPVRVALEGASFYKLPRVLRWATGSIGLHHLHHVRPGIPNYRLQECYNATPEVHIPPLTIRAGFGTVRLKLYDETRGCMVGFGPGGGFASIPARLRDLIVDYMDDMWKVFLLHAVAAHVSNGLVPVAGLLLILSLITRDVFLDRTVFHLLLVVILMIPVSFVSGVRDWRRKFGGGRAPVFFRKIWLTVLLFVLLGLAVLARITHGQLSGWLGLLYAGCIFGALPISVMLGHYGAKLASARK